VLELREEGARLGAAAKPRQNRIHPVMKNKNRNRTREARALQRRVAEDSISTSRVCSIYILRVV